MMSFPNRPALLPVLALTLTAGLAVPASAQLGGLSGLADSALGMPDVSSLGGDNLTGVLSYCVQNELLGGVEDEAQDVLGSLTGQQAEEEKSEGFSLGEAGTMIPEDGEPISIESLPEPVREQVCKLVLDQGKSML